MFSPKRRLYLVFSFGETWTRVEGCVRPGRRQVGREGQADSKGGESPEVWPLEDRLQDEDARGVGQELGRKQPPRLKKSKLSGRAGLCPLES